MRMVYSEFDRSDRSARELAKWLRAGVRGLTAGVDLGWADSEQSQMIMAMRMQHLFAY